MGVGETAASIEAALAARRDQRVALAPYIAEFFGTFILVFTYGCCAYSGSLAWAPTAVGLIVAGFAASCWNTSGGLLNPAVVVTLILVGRLRAKVGARLCAAQALGGLTAALLVVLCFAGGPNNAKPLVGPWPGSAVDSSVWGPVALVEIAFTAAFCFIYGSCAVPGQNNPDGDRNQFYGTALGCAFIGGGYAASGISGACLNPATSLLLLFSMVNGVRWCFAYILFQLIGAALGALLLLVTRPADFEHADFPALTRSRVVKVKLISEMTGTFFYALTFGLSLVMKSPGLWWSASAMLVAMTYALFSVSGAHFNPAVTLAVAVFDPDRCGRKEAVAFAASQLLASILAGVFTANVYWSGPYLGSSFSIQPNEAFPWYCLVLIELAFTFLLVVVFLALAYAPSDNSKTSHRNHLGLAVGVCVLVAGSAAGSITGGLINPALAYGTYVAASLGTAIPRLSGSACSTCMLLIYAEFAGALLAYFFMQFYYTGVMLKHPTAKTEEQARTDGFRHVEHPAAHLLAPKSSLPSAGSKEPASERLVLPATVPVVVS